MKATVLEYCIRILNYDATYTGWVDSHMPVLQYPFQFLVNENSSVAEPILKILLTLIFFWCANNVSNGH